MTDSKLKGAISRDGQAAHQMAETTATVSRPILLGIMRAMIDGSSDTEVGDWTAPNTFGNLESLTIARIENNC